MSGTLMTEKDKKPNRDDNNQKGNPSKLRYIQPHYKEKLKQ